MQITTNERALLWVIVALSGIMGTVRAICPWVCSCSDNDRTVNCTGQRMSHLPLNSVEKQTTRLLFGFNNLTSLDRRVLSRFQSVKELNLSNNAISSITSTAFSDMRSLDKLDLGGNRIQNLPYSVFRRLNAITYINLARNRFIGLPDMSRCSRLKTLLLSGNMLSSASALSRIQRLSQLQTLDLSGNNFYALPSPMLRNVPSLSYLSVSACRITQIDKNVFQGLRQMRVIDLSQNNLETMSATPFGQTPTLQVIRLSGNNFKCSCALRDFIHWLKSKNIQTPDRVTCQRDITSSKYSHDCYQYFTTTQIAITTSTPYASFNTREHCSGTSFRLNVTNFTNSSATVKWTYRGDDDFIFLKMEYRMFGVPASVKTKLVPLLNQFLTLHDLEAGSDYIVCALLKSSQCFLHECVDFSTSILAAKASDTTHNTKYGSNNLGVALFVCILLTSVVTGLLFALVLFLRRKNYSCQPLAPMTRILKIGKRKNSMDTKQPNSTEVIGEDSNNQTNHGLESSDMYETIPYEAVNSGRQIESPFYNRSEPDNSRVNVEGYTVPDIRPGVDIQRNVYTSLNTSAVSNVNTHPVIQEPVYVNSTNK